MNEEEEGKKREIVHENSSCFLFMAKLSQGRGKINTFPTLTTPMTMPNGNDLHI